MWKKRSALHVLLGGIIMSVLLASVTPAHARVYVKIAPPAVHIEVPGTPPSPAHVWIEGYHRWNGSAYFWVPGSWVLWPRPHAVWIPGHWQTHRRGWYWVEGHWGR